MRSIMDMQSAFQGADVLLHTLDLRGVATSLDNSSLFTLAEGTGGEYVHNRNNFTEALVGLSDRLSSGYVLGFTPAKAKRGQNTIEVKLKSGNATVRHRQGFSGTHTDVDAHDGLYLAAIEYDAAFNLPAFRRHPLLEAP
jgi:hypothetical protein